MVNKPRYQQARYMEPLIFEHDAPGRVGHEITKPDEAIVKQIGQLEQLLPKNLTRQELKLPRLSEVEIINHYIRLSQMNYGVDIGLYPLGSCTMKYNPKVNEYISSLEKATFIHPEQDPATAQGALEIMYNLQEWLADISGMTAVTLQPAAGAHGEFTGLMMIRAYHKKRNELDTRTDMLVPDAAHGTNPATAKMCGFNVVKIPSSDQGLVDVEALRAAVSEKTAGLMLTNPNTLGLFEKDIEEIAKIVHSAGGLLYYDGANLNANLGIIRPGDSGFDVVHMNLHKTFSTPHGGGGPGSGAVGCCPRLEAFLPTPIVVKEGDKYVLDYNKPDSIGKVQGYFGNFSVCLRAYAYIMALGPEGLRESSEQAVLASNYLMHFLKDLKGFELPYAEGVPRKHEFVLSADPMKKETGLGAGDVSKRLLDYGVHAPTNYFPLVVHEALMVEPTESFSKEVLDYYISAFKEISNSAYSNPEVVKEAPHYAAVSRLDEAKASRPTDLALTWRMHLKREKEKKGTK